MALRKDRHPEGEYFLTRDDIVKESKFPDAVLQRTLGDPTDTSPAVMPRVNERELIRVKPAEGTRPRLYTVDIPYHAFLPKKVKNLLLAGRMPVLHARLVLRLPAYTVVHANWRGSRDRCSYGPEPGCLAPKKSNGARVIYRTDVQKEAATAHWPVLAILVR